MSYKVLFDGNGSNIIQVVGLGLFVPAEAHDALMAKWAQAQAERDALAAHNQTLASVLGRMVERFEPHNESSEIIKRAIQALDPAKVRQGGAE